MITADDLHAAYRAGYRDGAASVLKQSRDVVKGRRRILPLDEPKRKSSKRQSPKQKLLSTMADKAWKRYKRQYPKGKKTYITIRAQVSRSQEYKRKAKRLK